jgi:hypothetical protein
LKFIVDGIVVRPECSVRLCKVKATTIVVDNFSKESKGMNGSKSN